MRPVIAPITLGPYFAVPGTVPLALSFAVGEDVTYTRLPGPSGPTESTVTHFNFEFLSLLAGGELGPYLAFFAAHRRRPRLSRDGAVAIRAFAEPAQ
jgi:hypothetical protein